jgi:hypothetical protein
VATNYVMVPVPEDLVDEVTTFTLTLAAKAALREWTDEAVVDFYEGADPPSRNLMVAAARAVAEGDELTEEEVAKAAGLGLREVVGIVRELGERGAKLKLPAIVISVEVDDDTRRRVLRISPRLARAILDAAGTFS